MSWGEIVRTALRNVRRRPLRNGFATLGIVLGTATLVVTSSRGGKHDVASRGFTADDFTWVMPLNPTVSLR